jgi:hypothetical protein
MSELERRWLRKAGPQGCPRSTQAVWTPVRLSDHKSVSVSENSIRQNRASAQENKANPVYNLAALRQKPTKMRVDTVNSEFQGVNFGGPNGG